MQTHTVSICIFYDKKTKKIIIQERGKNTRVGEKYHFWGGAIKKEETKEQAIQRELKEELNYSPKEIKYLYTESITIKVEGKYKNNIINIHVFLSPITKELRECPIYDGKSMIEINIDKAIELKDYFIDDAEKILKRVKEEIFT
jgi:8-oxo-dGTP pyrophosphatase MutT (NUDIX family)